MKNAKTLVPIICVLVGLGVGFLAGFEFKTYRLNKSFSGNQTAGKGNIQQTTKGNVQQTTNRGGAVFGSILSMDDKSVTVKLSDGSSKIVLFSDSTTYTNTIDAAKSDLKVGENVAVSGTSNSDGSVTAASVQINPKFQMGAQSFQNPTSSGSTKTTKTTEQSFDGPPPGGPMMP
jgi:hypothetical protein